jgi:hypothetical protein
MDWFAFAIAPAWKMFLSFHSWFQVHSWQNSTVTGSIIVHVCPFLHRRSRSTWSLAILVWRSWPCSHIENVLHSMVQNWQTCTANLHSKPAQQTYTPVSQKLNNKMENSNQ